MKIIDYKALRDLKIKNLYKNGAPILEIKKTFGVDDDLIKKICEDTPRSNKPKYTQKIQRSQHDTL